MDHAALGIEARHHVLDDTVLAGRIHGLQHDQDRPAIIGIQPFMQRS